MPQAVLPAVQPAPGEVAPAQQSGPALYPEIADLSGLDKAAGLVIALGSETSAGVLKFLTDRHLNELTVQIANTTSLPPNQIQAILSEAYEMAKGEEFLLDGGVDFARDALVRAFGEERANQILANLHSVLAESPFQFLRKADPVQLANHLRPEHPQTLAIVMANISPQQAAQVLAQLDAEVQGDVVARIINMDSTNADYVNAVATTLKTRLEGMLDVTMTRAGGLDFAVAMINNSDRSTEKVVLEQLDQESPDLAEEVRQQMFVFDNISQLDDKALQRALREIDSKELSVALKGSPESLKAKFFKNMSSRAADMLREDMSVMGPVRIRNVEEAQRRVVQIVRRLADAGEIEISRPGVESSFIN